MSADTSGKKVCTKKSTKTCSGDEGTDELLEMRSKHEWLSNKEERITRTGKEKENTSLTRGSGKSRLRLHEARRVNALTRSSCSSGQHVSSETACLSCLICSEPVSNHRCTASLRESRGFEGEERQTEQERRLRILSNGNCFEGEERHSIPESCMRVSITAVAFEARCPGDTGSRFSFATRLPLFCSSSPFTPSHTET